MALLSASFTPYIPVSFFTCLHGHSSLHCNIAFDAKRAVVTYLLFKKLCKLDKCRYTCVQRISRHEKSTWPCFIKHHSLKERNTLSLSNWSKKKSISVSLKHCVWYLLNTPSPFWKKPPVPSKKKGAMNFGENGQGPICKLVKRNFTYCQRAT